MKKQTAVEWLINQFIEGTMDSGEGGNMYITIPKSALNKALAMEKEHLLDFGYACATEIEISEIGELLMVKSPEDILNETYK